jgi:hypothetical protein
MQQGSTYNKFYEASYLQAYANGSLSHAEMHAIEKAALNDPFLADAMDGYVMQEEDKKGKILTQPLPKAVVAPKNFHWKTLAAAAGIFLVLGAAAFMIFGDKKELPTAILENNKKVELQTIDSVKKIEALAKEEIKLADTLLAKVVIRPNASKPIALPPSYSFTPNDNTNTYKVEEIINPIAAVNDSNKRMDDVAINDANKEFKAEEKTNVLRKAAAKSTNEGADLAKENSNKKDSAVAPPTATDYVINDNEKPKVLNSNQNVVTFNATTQNAIVKPRLGDKFNVTALNNNFKGQIVDNNNAPLSFAHITLPEKGIETYADSRGYYNFESLDTNIVMNIRAKGLTTNAIKVKPKKNNLIVIDGDSESDNLVKKEVVVTAAPVMKRKANAKYNEDSKDKKMDVLSTQVYSLNENSFKPNEAVPEVSNTLYELYLNNNTIFDDKLKNVSRSKGIIIVSFDINANGQPSNFKILQELTKTQNEDVIRLIKNGPLWKAKPNIKSVTVQIIAL